MKYYANKKQYWAIANKKPYKYKRSCASCKYKKYEYSDEGDYRDYADGYSCSWYSCKIGKLPNGRYGSVLTKACDKYERG